MSLTNSLSSSVEHGGILLRGYMYHVKNWIGICRITLLATFHWHRITLRGIYSDVTLPYLTLASEGGLARCGKSRTTLEVLGSIPTLAKSRLLVISAWWDAAKFLIAMAPLAISCTWNSSREPGPTPRKELPKGEECYVDTYTLSWWPGKFETSLGKLAQTAQTWKVSSPG
jgi:hypothetical protein